MRPPRIALFAALLVVSTACGSGHPRKPVSLAKSSTKRSSSGLSFASLALPAPEPVEIAPAPVEIEPVPVVEPAPAPAPEPVVAVEPVQAEPAKIEEPAKLEEPPKIEEPVKTEEPPKTEEPAKIEEPAPAVQPAPTEEPAPIEEPAQAEEPAQTDEPAAPETAAETPAPSYGLSGGWGGVREYLGEHGFTIDFNVSFEINSLLSGGLREETSAHALYDLSGSFDLDRIAGWKDAQLSFEAYVIDGHNPSENVGDFQSFSDISADEVAEIAQVFYEQWFGEHVWRLKLGKMDANSDFGAPANGTESIHSGTAYSPTTFPMVTYPNPATGILGGWVPNEHWSLNVGMYDGAAMAGVNTGGLGPATFFGNPPGFFFIGELGHRWKSGASELPGGAALGAWRHTGDFANTSGGTTHNTAGFYGTLDQELSHAAEGESGGNEVGLPAARLRRRGRRARRPAPGSGLPLGRLLRCASGRRARRLLELGALQRRRRLHGQLGDRLRAQLRLPVLQRRDAASRPAVHQQSGRRCEPRRCAGLQPGASSSASEIDETTPRGVAGAG